VTRHLLCLTIDTDPDGLAGKTLNRQALSWKGLEDIHPMLESIDRLSPNSGPIPITWFIRADGQLRDVLGSTFFLLHRFQTLWAEVTAAGHELAWHPHLYHQARPGDKAVLITDPIEAVEEITRLWEELSSSSFRAVSFRNGEGWHSSDTFAMVERLGFLWDSTAIPGRAGNAGHPLNWAGAPNHPYFPDHKDIRRPGAARSLLEIPMNTWRVKTPYDTEPRLRYMNPAVHEKLFAAALDTLNLHLCTGVHVWTFILHPNEVLRSNRDALYAGSVETVCHNLKTFAESIRNLGGGVEFVTISRAGEEWVKREMIS